jgi:deoxyribose-phosphate aldolase
MKIKQTKKAEMSSNKITVTFPQLAKMIDHSLLHPTMTDTDIKVGSQSCP